MGGRGVRQFSRCLTETKYEQILFCTPPLFEEAFLIGSVHFCFLNRHFLIRGFFETNVLHGSSYTGFFFYGSFFFYSEMARILTFFQTLFTKQQNCSPSSRAKEISQGLLTLFNSFSNVSRSPTESDQSEAGFKFVPPPPKRSISLVLYYPFLMRLIFMGSSFI